VPPIFGIVNTRLHPVESAMISRIKQAAVYSNPRIIGEWLLTDGFLAASTVRGNPLASRQAVMAEKGPWVVVADACMYKQAEKKDGSSDTAYILDAWLKHGPECVNRLYGDFAFVIFHTETGEVFCGRDPIGVRPLFYTLHNGLFIFASELRLVTAALPENPEVQQDYLLDTLITTKSEKHLTPFAGVHRLRPAHILKIKDGMMTTREYWRADPERVIRMPCEEDYLALFREKLVDAVQMRCNGVARTGSELSGGLDSSAVTGIAAAYHYGHA
jgi:asparagine synthetase B (glutamine-hydrolysing)